MKMQVNEETTMLGGSTRPKKDGTRLSGMHGSVKGKGAIGWRVEVSGKNKGGLD